MENSGYEPELSGGDEPVLDSVKQEEVGFNPELDALLSDATKTKSDEAEESKSKSSVMTDEEAAGIVAGGLGGILGLAKEFGGLDIVIPEKTATLAISLFCPLVKKYGGKIKFNPKGVDLDGWMPEVLALGGAGVLGFTIDKQLKEKKIGGVSESGDKSEHS